MTSDQQISVLYRDEVRRQNWNKIVNGPLHAAVASDAEKNTNKR